jgi:low affinity Fe/Cu permease
MMENMSEEDNSASVGKILAEIGKKIDELIAETKDAKDDLVVEIEKQVKVLKEKKEKIEADIENYKDTKDERWLDAKEHLSSALDEMKKAINAVIKK